MTAPMPQATVHATIESYLTEVAARLVGPARMRGAILAELRDGLMEALGTRLARGVEPAHAAAAAIGEFGDPPSVARGFASELAAATARRVAFALASTGPPIGLLWAAAYAGRFGLVHVGPPWRWPAAPTGAWLAFPLICAVVAIAGLAALTVVASTSRLSRWLPMRPTLAPVAAAAVAAAAMTVDLTMLGLLASQVVTRPGSLAWSSAAAAATASLTRLTLAGWATSRCQTSRAAVA